MKTLNQETVLKIKHILEFKLCDLNPDEILSTLSCGETLGNIFEMYDIDGESDEAVEAVETLYNRYAQ